MRFPFITLVLIATTVAVSQTKTPAPDHVATPQADTRSVCPVNIKAKERNSYVANWTISDEDSRKSGQLTSESDGSGVHVELRSNNHAVIKLVSLQVFFPGSTEPHGYYQPASQNSQTTPTQSRELRNLRKTFYLAADGGAALQLTGDLLVDQIAGITRVALLRVEYADGTTWTAPSSQTCSVEPSHVQLIG